MTTVLLVDDEKIEREGLRFLLERQFAQLQILEAVNGVDALCVLGEQHVDIMITDIRMPFMDGLTLAERARSRWPELQIALYTAYAEFEYARQAMKYGVTSYLLKPIDVDVFNAEMAALLERCARRSAPALDHLQRERIWYDLLHGRPLTQEMEARLGQMGRDVRRDVPPIALLTFSDDYLLGAIERLEAGISDLTEGSWLLDSSRMLLLLGRCAGEDLQTCGQVLQQRVDERLNQRPTVIIARPESIDALSSTYRYLDERCGELLIAPGSLVVLEGRHQLPVKALRSQLEAVNERIRRAGADACAVRMELDGLNLLMESLDGAPSKYVRYALAGIFHNVRSAFPELIAEQWIDEIYEARSVGALCEGIGRCASLLPVDSGDEVVSRMIQLIHSSYMDDLTLEDVAQQVFMTPTYVSYMFKQHTGQTFIKYLNAYRLERARELIVSTQKKFTDIMMETGYNNSSYFSYVFRTQYGMTPSQYRKQYGRG